MRLSNLCIDKPVFATVISLVLILFGVLGFNFLTVSYMPDQFRPHMYVFVKYPGASAELVERTITDKIENALAATPNLEYMHSKSTYNSSEVELNFKNISRTDFLTVQSDVIREVSEINDLPVAASKPEVGGGGSSNFIIAYDLYDSHMTAVEAANYIKQYVVKPLQRVPGVGQVHVQGFTTALRIAVDPRKLSAYGLTIGDVLSVLKNNNVSFSVGSIINQSQQIPISAQVRLPSLSSFKSLALANLNGHIIHLKDVATLSMGPQNPAGGYLSADGHLGSGVAIFATDSANPIVVGQAVRTTMNSLRQYMPPGMHLNEVIDKTVELKEAVNSVFHTIFEAMILVTLVVLIFIGRWRSAVIPIVTIPVCLISTFMLMYIAGFNINILTLMALVLAVGMVVDDAIVIMENTDRHIESGMDSYSATRRSIREISFAVIGMTICLLAVYFPTAFMHGGTATKFQAFAFTLAFSVLISGFVALTLSPMMCSRLLVRHEASRYEVRLARFFATLRLRYQSLLTVVLRRRWWVVGIFVLLLGVGVKLYMMLPTALLPKDPSTGLFAYVQGPATASPLYMKKLAEPVDQYLENDKNVLHFTNFGGGTGNNASNWSMFFIGLQPWEKLTETPDQIAKAITHKIKSLPGVTGSAVTVDLNSNTNSNQSGQMQFMVLGLGSYKELSQAAQRLADALKSSAVFNSVNNTLKFNTVSYNIAINRNLAVALNVPFDSITQALTTYFGGPQLQTQFVIGDQSYPIVVQLPKKNLVDFNVLKHIYVKNITGQLLPLSRFVTVASGLTLPERNHYNQMRAASIGANMNSQFTMGQAIKAVEQTAKQVLPAGMQIAFQGEAKHMLDNSGDLSLIFVLGLIFIYLVLAALFESFVDPLIVLLTVPLCIVGALFALNLIGASLNVFTGIGLVTLIGLVSKHGILITQFANQQLADGKPLSDAIINAAAIRLRPILMTTITMVLGAAPLVFGSGPGSVGRAQIGWVIIAGLLLGTFFSLFVVPVAYRLLSGLKWV